MANVLVTLRVTNRYSEPIADKESSTNLESHFIEGPNSGREDKGMGATANVQGTGYRAQGSLDPRASRRFPTAGFTLVEMLVVIVIIGILGSLITGAAIVARNRAKRAMVRSDISQFELALTRYKQEVGEFPPDFANLQNSNATVRLEAQNAVLRHLRKRFPRYTPTGISGTDYSTATNPTWERFRDDVRSHYFKDDDTDNTWDPGEACIDPNLFDAASSLVFWLGGMAEERWPAKWKPAGFHANVQFPFAPGLPRTEPMCEFDPSRILTTDNIPRYCANTDAATPPYVYFRALRPPNATLTQYEYGYIETTGGTTPTYTFYPLSYPAYGVSPSNNWGRAVPYLDDSIPGNPTNRAVARVWRNQDTFQIVFGGFDNTFGSDNANFRFSKLGQYIDRTGGTSGNPMTPASGEDANFDNITNFTSDTLEAEMH